MLRWQPRLADLQLSLRVAVAAVLATVIAQWLALPHPLYALVSAVIVTDLSAKQTQSLGWPRTAGTAVGGVLGAGLGTVLPPGVWTVGLGILLAMTLTNALGLRPAARLAGYVCGIVLLDHGGEPWAYAVARMVETCLGIAAAILVSYVPKLLRNGAPPR